MPESVPHNHEQHPDLAQAQEAGRDTYLKTLQDLRRQFPHKSAAELDELADAAAIGASDDVIRSVVGVQPEAARYDSMMSAHQAMEAKSLEPQIATLRQALDTVQAQLEEARARKELDKDQAIFQQIRELHSKEIDLQEQLDHLVGQHDVASRAARWHAADARRQEDLNDVA